MQGQDLTRLRGANVVDLDGDKIGKVEEIYLDQDTDEAEWALVNTGMFGTKSTFVPLQGAEVTEDQLRVPIEKARVKDAPNIEAGRELSQSEEAELYSYYGMSYSESESDSGLPQDTPTTGGDYDTVGHDTSGPTTDDAMTRSEEQLRVGTQRQETGQVRLRKHVDTERVSETVPVTREEARIEREPITDSNVGDATSGPAFSEDEHEVTLTEERPVVEKEEVPVERVRVDTDTVTEQAQVDEEVRKERIELDEEQGSSGYEGGASNR